MMDANETKALLYYQVKADKADEAANLALTARVRDLEAGLAALKAVQGTSASGGALSPEEEAVYAGVRERQNMTNAPDYSGCRTESEARMIFTAAKSKRTERLTAKLSN